MTENLSVHEAGLQIKKEGGASKSTRTARYILYAIGEIALVMIGILLALQVNNWNNKLKDQKMAKVYMTDLVTDLKSDIEILTAEFEENEKRIAQIDTIFQTYKTGAKLSKQEKIKLIFRHGLLTTETYFVPEKSTIKQIESSSHGSIIKNKKLRDKLFRYYTAHDKNEMNNERSVQLYQHNFTVPIIIEVFWDGDLREMTNGTSYGLSLGDDYMDLIRNKKYAAAISLRKGNCQSQNREYGAAIGRAEVLIEMLEMELKEPTK